MSHAADGKLLQDKHGMVRGAPVNVQIHPLVHAGVKGYAAEQELGRAARRTLPRCAVLEGMPLPRVADLRTMRLRRRP